MNIVRPLPPPFHTGAAVFTSDLCLPSLLDAVRVSFLADAFFSVCCEAPKQSDRREWEREPEPERERGRRCPGPARKRAAL